MFDLPLALSAELQLFIAQRGAWRGSLDELAALAMNALELDSPRFDIRIRRLLIGNTLRRLLWARGCALWVGNDGQFRLVYQRPLTRKMAQQRLKNAAAGYCAFCGMKEPTAGELIYRTDVWCHAPCALAYSRMVMAAAEVQHG